MIKTHYGDKLAGHISRDATAVHAREKAAILTSACLHDSQAAIPLTQMRAGRESKPYGHGDTESDTERN